MSKNIVDAINEFCKETNNKIGLIPSRRQVEWDGGYVNNTLAHISSASYTWRTWYARYSALLPGSQHRRYATQYISDVTAFTG